MLIHYHIIETNPFSIYFCKFSGQYRANKNMGLAVYRLNLHNFSNNFIVNISYISKGFYAIIFIVCKIPLPSARATIGYFVYNQI